ncbi:MAG: T9SS type A sorting domain-containing protein [Bacteroidales bacterium]|nr:T9SS type A sorting domain-containing protein [Bacteroidales bacterium]
MNRTVLFMKDKLLLAIVIFLSLNVYSQSFNVKEYNKIDGLQVKTSNAILEASDGSIIVSISFLNGENRIMKINDKGEILGSKYIEIGGGANRGYYPFFRHPYMENTNVYVYFEHGEPTAYNAVVFDNNLNVLDNVRVDLPYSDIDRSNYATIYKKTECCILDSQNNIVIMKRLDESSDFMFIKLDIEGNLVMNKVVTLDSKEYYIPYYSLFVYNEEPMQYAFSYHNYGEYKKTSLVVLDSDFNVIETKQDVIPHDIYSIMTCNSGLDYEIAAYDDEHYLTSSSYFSGGPLSSGIKLMLMDKNNNVVNEYKYVEIHEGYERDRPELSYKSIVTGNNGEIYWIYIKPNPTIEHGRDLYVTLFDAELNPLWEQKVKSDVSYIEIMSSSVRSSGDLLISAYDKYKQIYTIVCDRSAMPLNVDESMELRPYSFYPNPATDVINIHYSPDVNVEKVEIYGMDGKMYHEQNFNMETININSLSNGIYMMKVVLDNGNTYTDKIAVK